MSASKPPRAERKPSLGVNFEHGTNGAVVVYMGRHEVVIAYLPDGYAVDAKASTVLAVAYKTQNERKPLTVLRTKIILDRIKDSKFNPVVVGKQSISFLLDALDIPKEQVNA